jgi:hypothetical protein
LWHLNLSTYAHIAACAAALLMTYLCCHPVLSFVRRGWEIKKQDILNGFSRVAKRHYLQSFLNLNVAENEADTAFDEMYNWRYGRYRLTVPLILLTLVLLPLCFLVAERALAAIGVSNGWHTDAGAWGPPLMLPGIAIAGIIGAYVWIVVAHVQAASSYNLPPATILSSALRMVVAVPMGYALSSIAAKGIGPLVAFAFGAFPLGAVQIFLQRIAAKQLSLDMSADEKRDQVTKLSGVDPQIADRLRDADISTVPQLAYCDPVQVSMRTNLGFSFVLDLMGQALAWIYLEAKMEALRPLGLRGAVEIRNLVDDLGADDTALRASAEATFAAAARAASVEPASAFRGVCEEIAEDPYTQFISEIWDDSFE